jgi:hypothetical protein
MTLPQPVFVGPPEPFMSGDENVCDPQKRPGVEAFADFVLAHQGGVRGRTVAPCGRPSGHSSGRAWDWMINAHQPEQRSRADELIDWLLANNAEIFRRAGLSYIIWNKRIWGAKSQQWKPYDGYDELGNCTSGLCRNPHTDHVHFSFNVPGGAAETSFYAWLADGSPESLPVTAKPAQKPPWGAFWLSFAIALGATGLYRWRQPFKTSP